MSARLPAMVRTWRVGKHFTVTLTVPQLAVGEVACGSCEWSPAVPATLTVREQNDYQRGLVAALASLKPIPSSEVTQ